MSKKLTLETLAVETFTTQGVGDLSFAAAVASKNYSDCGSCGIACTAIDCEPPSANYSDCGSCGIGCTPVLPC